MTQQTIEIEGLPEGYKVLGIKLDEEINHTWPGSVKSVKATLYVQKIQPRRKLSAQEIAEDYDPSAPNGYD